MDGRWLWLRALHVASGFLHRVETINVPFMKPVVPGAKRRLQLHCGH